MPGRGQVLLAVLWGLVTLPRPVTAGQPGADRYGDPLPAGAVARLGTTRFRAPAAVEGLALAPDSKVVAAFTGAGVFLFDTVSGQRIQRLDSSDLRWIPANPLVFSPDGRRLAGRGWVEAGKRVRSVVRVWDLVGAPKQRDYHADNVAWVGWSAHGEPLALGLEKGALRLYELAAGRARDFACEGLPGPELSRYALCAGLAIGPTLAVADEQCPDVHVWDCARAGKRRTFRPRGDAIYSLDVSPDGRRLVSVTNQAVQLWDVTTGRLLYTVASRNNYRSCRFSADGKLLAIADSWRAVCFWDAATGRERGRTRAHYVLCPRFSLSADGKVLAATESFLGAIHLFDITTGAERPRPAGQRGRAQGTFAPDGRRVATAGGLDGTIHVWDLATSASLLRIERPGQWVRDIAFSRDGRSLFSTWNDDNLWVSDAATGERLDVITLEDPDRPDTRQSGVSMHLSGDGKRLAAFSHYYSRKHTGGPLHDEMLLTGWDTSTHRQLFRRRLAGLDSWHALSADNRVLAVAQSQGRREMGIGRGPMRLEDVATGEHRLTFPVLQGRTWPLAFSPDGRLLAVNNYRRETAPKTLRLLEIATTAEVLTLPAPDTNLVAFSPDSQLLALAAPGQEILVQDLARGRALRRLTGFAAQVTGLAFSPDGRRLLSGLDDSTLLVWDVGPGEPVSVDPLAAERVTQAWVDLAGSDAARAFRARGLLASAPEEALALLKNHVHRVQPADPQRVRRLLADLDSEQFAVRQKAQRELRDLGELAEPVVRQTLAGPATLEVRRGVQELLDRCRDPIMQPEMLRSLRAAAVLEDIGTRPARRLLEELAQGAPEAHLTREVKASLDRLSQRPVGR